MKAQQGFTLIELLMVIAVLGILAAVSVGKFYNITGSAAVASAQGVATQLGQAMANNYVMDSGGVGGNPATKCNDAILMLEQGALPAGYTVSDAASPTGATVVTVTTPLTTNNCTVTYTDPSNASITGTATYTFIPAP